MEQGLSCGHFDPMFWLIGSWLSRMGQRESLIDHPLRHMALIHFQNGPVRVTRANAAFWIARNILTQSVQMKSRRWPYLQSRRLDLAHSLAPTNKRNWNDYWRSGGLWGGVWFYTRENLRDESSWGTWLVIASIPEPFVFQFSSCDRTGTVVLPGPIPPRCIVKQGPAAQVLPEIERQYGRIDAYLQGLETLDRT